ncbi:MAG: hypothetical protein PUG10_01440 [Lachnospiraceae bacterium]|nr:hypothetical protein [Lachnospiraceae bacterium]
MKKNSFVFTWSYVVTMLITLTLYFLELLVDITVENSLLFIILGGSATYILTGIIYSIKEGKRDNNA